LRERSGMKRFFTIGLLALALVASGRAPRSQVYRVTGTSSLSASPVSNDARNSETVVDLPTIGSVSWTCKGGKPLRFSTTFLAANAATERVSYSIDGAALVSKTLQPGQHLSTPFTGATSHVWTVEQRIDPWNTYATISVGMSPDPVFGCINPTVTVSRVRVDNA